MSDQVDIDRARQAFADAIRQSDYIPGSAAISIQPAIGEAAAFHCRWPLVEKAGNYSREITVMVTSDAIKRFRLAEARERGAILTQFVRILNVRLLDGHYYEKEPPSPPFLIHIDDHSLEP
jgi:hypothetical protein